MKVLRRSATRTAASMLVAVALLGVPGVASASAPPPRTDASELVPPGIRRTIEQLPGGTDFLEEIEEARTDGECECDFAYPLADVDEDGTTDVLYGTDLSTPPVTRFSILHGRTGEPLFPTPVQVPGWAYGAAADLGVRGPGFVYFSWDYLSPEGAVTAGAVDATGTRLWERRWDDVRRWTPGGRAELGGFMAADLLRGADGVTDVVVASSASVGGPFGNPSASAVLLERISGDSGATEDAGTYRADALDGVAIDALEPDDGAPSLLVQTSSHVDNGVLVELRRDLGEAEWSTRVKPLGGYFMYPEEADVAGDSAAEILVHVRGPVSVQALDRATGRPVWSRPGTVEAVIPGRAGATSDVLVDRTSIDDGTVGYGVSRRSTKGRLRWTASFRVSEKVHASTWGFGYARPVGDATGDGAADVRADVYLLEDDGDRLTIRDSEQYLVDGRSGATIRGGPRYFPLTGSFTRSGTDAVEFRRTQGGLEAAGLDGGTSDVLWRSTLSVPPGSPPCSWSVGVLTTESGPDLLFLELPVEHGDSEIVVDGASGEILWST